MSEAKAACQKCKESKENIERLEKECDRLREDVRQATSLVARRIASWLDQRYDDMSGSAHSAYLEAFDDIADDIRSGEWDSDR